MTQRDPIPRWKDALRKTATIMALGGSAGLLFGCAPAEKPSISATTEVPSPSPSNTETVSKWLPEKGDYLSPANLAELDAADIKSYFEFRDGDFTTAEEMARLDAYRDEAFFSAGTSEEEWAVYRDSGVFNAFADAQDKRYTVPMMKGIHKTGLTNENFMDLRYGILQRVDASRRYSESPEGQRNKAEVYVLQQSFVELVSSEGSVEDGTITAVYRLTCKDNLDKTQLTKFGDYDSLSSPAIKTVTMERQSDGIWKTTHSAQHNEQ